MFRSLAAAAVFLVSIGAAHAKLEIQDFRLQEGEFGPRRSNTEYRPFEVVYWRASVAGLTKDPDGCWNLKTTIILESHDGSIIGTDTGAMKSRPAGEAPAAVHWEFKITSKLAGKHRIRITVRDNTTTEEASLEREISVRPLEFAVHSPRFYFDEGKKYGASPRQFVTAQDFVVAVNVAGFDGSQGKYDVAVAFTVLKGRGEVIHAIGEKEYKLDEARIVASTVPARQFWAGVHIREPGEYFIEAIATDRLTGRKASLRVPVTVHAP